MTSDMRQNTRKKSDNGDRRSGFKQWATKGWFEMVYKKAFARQKQGLQCKDGGFGGSIIGVAFGGA